MHADGGYYGIALGINYADIIGSGIHNVNFRLLRIAGNAGRIVSHRNALDHIEAGDGSRGEVDHAYRVALAIRHIRIFPVTWPVIGQRSLMEIPPSDAQDHRRQHDNDKEFSQGCGSWNASDLLHVAISTGDGSLSDQGMHELQVAAILHELPAPCAPRPERSALLAPSVVRIVLDITTECHRKEPCPGCCEPR